MVTSMSNRLPAEFETDIRPVGDAVLLCTRREGLSSETALFVTDDSGGPCVSLNGPARIHALAGRPGRWVALTGDALGETRDQGRTWVSKPLPALPPPALYADVTLAGDRAWVAGGERVVVEEDGGWRVAWHLPRAGRELLVEVLPLGPDEVLVLSNSGRVHRGRPSSPSLDDWSQGLPAIPTGGGAPTMARVGETYVAALGDLYARRDGDPSWVRLDESAGPDGSWRDTLLWLAPTGIAAWVASPWELGAFYGTDSRTVFLGGPGRPVQPVWQRPDGRPVVRRLDADRDAVFVSFRRTTPALAGAVIRSDGVVAIRLR
jgi:hypothetical protein